MKQYFAGLLRISLSWYLVYQEHGVRRIGLRCLESTSEGTVVSRFESLEALSNEGLHSLEVISLLHGKIVKFKLLYSIAY
jgi:hypothetical protein